MNPDRYPLLRIDVKPEAAELWLGLLSTLEFACIEEKESKGQYQYFIGFDENEKIETVESRFQNLIDSIPEALKKTLTHSETRWEEKINWNLKFQKSLQAFQITDRFKIIPEDLASQEVSSDTVNTAAKSNIIIPYGLAFGTGEHATTQVCAQLVEDALSLEGILSQNKEALDILDLGCGTGILALIAAKLGRHKILGVDIDAEALEVARKALSLNQHPSTISLSQELDAQLQFDLVIANIIKNTLIEVHDLIIQALKAKAYLILSGITYRQKEIILEKYSELTLIKTLNHQGWSALLLQKK